MRAIARHAETPDDVLAGISIRHEAYQRTGPVTATQARRLASRREHRAAPWVLDRGDGVLVAALLCYPLELALDDAALRGYGLGSVGTLVAHRRQGHAATLCRAVCAASEATGPAIGLLYSDIAPAYYERMGFVAHELVEWKCERLVDFASSGEVATLAPVDPRREVERLTHAYVTHHRGRLHSRRNAGRFLDSIEDASDDWFFAVGSPDRAYVRLSREPSGWIEIAEWILDDPASEVAVLRSVARLAHEAGGAAISGWTSPPREARAWFVPVAGSGHLPMLRGGPLGVTPLLWPSDHF